MKPARLPMQLINAIPRRCCSGQEGARDRPEHRECGENTGRCDGERDQGHGRITQTQSRGNQPKTGKQRSGGTVHAALCGFIRVLAVPQHGECADNKRDCA